MFNVVRMARARRVALPDDFVDVVAKAHEMYLYAQQPDHLLPMFNDCNPSRSTPPLLRAAAGSTGGMTSVGPPRRGGSRPTTPPTPALGGYYCLRSGWGEEDQYLFFDGAAWGASHQHEDKLSFVLHAGGRTLIGDPNIYSYSRTELTHYFRSSRAHNVVLIDRMEQARKHRPEAKLETLGRNEWVSRDAFDFVSSEYLEGYAPNPYEPLPAPPEVDTSLSHRRAIWYVKGEYWILCDLIRGADAAEHTLEQIYHLAPIYEPGAAVPFRAGEVSARPEEILTRDEGLANLAILPVDRTGLSVRAEKGQTSPAVGWYGVLGEYPAWDVTLEACTALPARLDAVLYPVAAGADPARTRPSPACGRTAP